MSLIPHEPMGLLRDFNRWFEAPSVFNGRDTWSPAVDIREENNELVVVADVPGVDPKNIQVTTSNGMLTIKGERSSEKEVKEKNYQRLERSYGSFLRSFTLPPEADTDHIKAKTKDGVLEIHIPKTAKAPEKRIAVEC